MVGLFKKRTNRFRRKVRSGELISGTKIPIDIYSGIEGALRKKFDTR